MISFEQAKKLFNSFISVKPKGKYMNYIYEGCMDGSEKSIRAGLVMMWHKKDLSDQHTVEAINATKVYFLRKQVKQHTVG